MWSRLSILKFMLYIFGEYRCVVGHAWCSERNHMGLALLLPVWDYLPLGTSLISTCHLVVETQVGLEVHAGSPSFAQDWGIQIRINPSATRQAFYSLSHLLQLFIFQMQKILMQRFYILFKYCMKTDLHCLDFLCNFGKMESGKEASVHIQLEGRPSILEMVSLKSDR